MVTAGIYLLLRFNPLFGFSPILIWLGAATALFGAVYGYVQTDLKRTIAYSTTSQLGYMVLACGLGQYGLALAHLVNHAFFKALLFLSAGSVIHGIHDEQDIRKMGGLMTLMPLTYITSMVGSLSLVALPFLTGYYSKDFILQTAFGTTGYLLGLAAAYFTAFYSLKLLHRVFWLPPQSKVVLQAHEPSAWMLIPTTLLTVASVSWGYMAQYHAALAPALNTFYLWPQNQIGMGHLPWWVDWLPLAALLVAPLAIHPHISFNIPTLKFNLFPFLQLGQITNRYLDNGWFGLMGPQGAVLGLNKVASSLDLLSSRYLPHLFMVPMAILLLSLV